MNHTGITATTGFPLRAQSERVGHLPERLPLAVMIFTGAALRVLGLFFNGMHDVEEMIFGWGTTLLQSGFSEAQGGGWDYGVFSYGLHTISTAMAWWLPRFWWLPYKAIGLGCELGVLALLLRLSTPEHRRRIMWMYWLNPCFIVHVSWLGYWDAPVALMALAAVALARDGQSGPRWAGVGAALAVAANLKPQGVAYFLLPATIYLVSLAVLGFNWKPLFRFALGALMVYALAALLLVIGGAPSPDPAVYFLNATATMPNLSNGGLNIWRPIVTVYQVAHGQTGPPYDAQIEPSLDWALNAVGWAATATLILVFCVVAARDRRRDASRPSADSFCLLAVLSFSALAFPAFAPRVHLGHGYLGLTLLVLWTLRGPALNALGAMTAVQCYALLATYGIGQSRLPNPLAYPQAAQGLIDAVYRTSSAAPNLLRGQVAINDLLGLLYSEPVLSTLAAVQFALALFLLTRMMRSVSRSARPEESHAPASFR